MSFIHLTSVIIISLIIIIALGVITMKFIFPVFRVCGLSMYPTYKDNDILLGRALFFSKLEVGCIYTYHPPSAYNDENECSGYTVIKRLKEIKTVDGQLYCWFEGDNKNNSYDSREYGFVHSNRVTSKIIKVIRKEK